MLAPGWWRCCCRVGRCVVTNVGPTQESDLHVSVFTGGEVSQVGSRVELFEEIRRDRRVEALSIRELAERHKVHRRAVRQALASALPPPRKEYVARSRPAIDQWSGVIDAWLVADKDAPRKQRHTARRVWKRLVAEHGATLSEVTVSRYVARRRVELDLVHTEVFIPQAHEPGGEALCGNPHNASYAAPGNMRRAPRPSRHGRGTGPQGAGVIPVSYTHL